MGADLLAEAEGEELRDGAERVADAVPELAAVAQALCEGETLPQGLAELLSETEPQSDEVAEPVGEWEDEAQTLAHTEALVVTLLVTVSEPHGEGVEDCEAVPLTDPHGDGVAESEAVGHSVAEPLPLEDREAMLALPLVVGV